MFNSLKKIFPKTKGQISFLPKSANLFNFTKFNFSAAKEHTEDDHDDTHAHHHEEAKEYHDFKFDRVSYNQELNSEQRSKY